MEQMTVNSVLALFPETKSEISTFVSKAVESALNGYENPLKLQVQISALEQVLKGIKDNADFKEASLKEADKYGQKSFTDFNSTIQVKETGVKYDYSNCGYPVYNEICEKINELNTQKKQIEDQLKAIKEETKFVDENTGEEITILPPTKTSTTSVVITLNK